MVLSERVNLLLTQIQTFYGWLKIKGSNVHIASWQGVKTMGNNNTIVYKIFDLMSKKIKLLDTDKIGKCLALVLGEVIFFTQRSKFATTEGHFSSVDGAWRGMKVFKTLKTEEVVLLPSYMGQHMSHVRMKEVSPQEEVT